MSILSKINFPKTAMAAVAAAGVMTGVAGTVIGSKAFDGALKYENTRESRQKLTDEISKSNPELAYRLTLDDLKNTLDDYTYMALFGTPPNDKEAQIENDLREAQKKSQALVTAGLALALLGGAGYGHFGITCPPKSEKANKSVGTLYTKQFKNLIFKVALPTLPAYRLVISCITTYSKPQLAFISYLIFSYNFKYCFALFKYFLRIF